MARRSCRNSALVRSYARKAGGDGSLQARFALRPTASHVRARPPPTAPYPVTKLRTSRPRTPVAATAFGELTVRRRVCLPELRSPAATFTAASFRQPCTHSNRAPMATACPGAAHLTARLASQLMLRRTDGAGVPIPRQPPDPWCVPFHSRPPHGTSCPTAVYPRSSGRQWFSSTQRTKKRPAERWSLWQFANYAQIIQRVPSGDDQARRPADGA